MSENLHNIDDLFKKAIDQHEDTPSPNLWEAIDKSLDKTKVVSISKKYNKLKWAAAALLLFSFGMAMYTLQTKMKNKELVKMNNINKASKSNNENIKNIEKKSTPGSLINENDKNLHEERIEEQINTEETANTSVPEKKTNSQNSSEEKNIKFLKEKTQQIVAYKKEKPSSAAKQTDDDLYVKNNETVLVEKKDLIEKETNIPGRYIVDIPLFVNHHQLINILQVHPANPYLFNNAIFPSNNDLALKNNKIATAKKSSSTPINVSKISATLFFSPEFTSNNVKEDHPRYREDNRHEIKNTESVKTSSSYGVAINYAIGNKISIQSGASVFTRVTDINPKTIYARPDRMGDINYRLSCSAGSIFVPLKSGANPAQGDSTKILSAKNTLQYISIPFGLNYTVGKGKFTLIAGAGIAANILSKGKVETVIATAGGNESSTTNNIEGLRSNYFNSKLSLGASYQVSKLFALNFTPTATMALSSINKDAPVKTKINSFGLSAGVTIKL